MPIDVKTLKSERDQLKADLRTLETDQRKIEAELKGMRQREIKMKREIEALSTLIEMQDSEDKNGDAGKSESAAGTDA